MCGPGISRNSVIEVCERQGRWDPIRQGSQPPGRGPVPVCGPLGTGPWAMKAGGERGGWVSEQNLSSRYHLSSTSLHPTQQVCGKMVFHETGPRGLKGWGLLPYRTQDTNQLPPEES